MRSIAALAGLLALVLLPVPLRSQVDQQLSDASMLSLALTEAQPPDTNPLVRPARLRVEDVLIGEALSLLQEASGVSVAYSPTLLPENWTVTCECEETTVADAIEVLLAGTGFDYLIVSGQLVIRRSTPTTIDRPATRLTDAPGVQGGSDARAESEAPPGPQAVGMLTGRVEDAGTGQPLASVQIFIEGLDVGVLSQQNGRYLLQNVPEGTHSLTADRIGYRTVTREVTVGEAETVVQNFSLSEEALSLDELIVTGTPGGTQRRAIGNDVARVNAEAIVQQSPTVSLQGALGQRVPGLSIPAPAAEVGTGSPMRIRGTASISLSNEPIVYVDGVRINTNPQAGPSTSGGQTSRTSFLAPRVSRLNDLNPDEIESIEVIKGPAAATLYGTEASGGVIQILTKRGSTGAPTFSFQAQTGANWVQSPEERTGLSWRKNPDTGEMESFNVYSHQIENGYDPAFSTGILQSYNASVRGGSEQVRYYSSLGWDKNVGVFHWNTENKLNARLNLGMTASEELGLEISLGFVRSHLRSPGTGIVENPWDVLFWNQPATRDGLTRGYWRATPEAIASDVEETTDVNRLTSSFQVTWEPWSWLTHRVTAGVDLTNETNTNLIKRNPLGTAFFFGRSSLGEKQISTPRTTFTTADYAATAEFDLRPSISSATSVGVQYYEKDLHISYSSGEVFPTPDVTTIGAASVTTGSEESVQNRTFGAYVQERLGWNDRVFVTGAVRADDNSAFGTNYNAAIYPKLSATWVLSEEAFWDIGGLDPFRLRAAWGASGRQPDAFAAQRLYAPVAGADGASVLTPGEIGNPDLRPERGEEIEVGFDVSFWDERASASFTYYDRLTSDAILTRSVAPSEGFGGFQYVNAGEVKNWGTELSIDARALDLDVVDWDVGIAFATMNNRIESMGGVPEFQVQSATFKEGYPLGALFAKKVLSAEHDANGDLINALCDGGVDAGHSAVACGDAPPVYWGRGSTPTWEFSLQNTLTIREDLQLSAQIDGRGGHLIQSIRLPAAHQSFNNTYHAQCDCDPIFDAYMLFDRQATGFYEGDFVKLRSITARYTLPERWVDRIGASGGSVSVGASNLHTLYGKRYVDIVPGIEGGVIKGPGNDPGGPSHIWDPEIVGSQQLAYNAHSTAPITSAASIVSTIRFTF